MSATNFSQANQLLRNNKAKDAIIAYQNAIEQNPNFHWGYHNLGEALEQLGRLEEAISAYQQALQLKPNLACSYLNLGKALNKLGREKEAQKTIDYAVQLEPKLGKFTLYNGTQQNDNLDKQVQKINKSQQKKHTLKVAVCIHIFYEHLWEKIAQYLANITVSYDLFITCPWEKKYAVSTILTQTHPNAWIEGIENFGMDVAPFIHCINQFELWNYDVVLKLHTKNDRSEIREEQGNILFQGTLGSKKLVDQILNKFSADVDLGMVGPDYLYRSAQYLMYGNRHLVENFRKSLHLENYEGDWGFFAGTMFWIRGSLLGSLVNPSRMILKLLGSSQSSTGGDSSPAHAFERMFGLLPTANGMKTGLTYRCDSKASQFLLQVPEFDNILQHPFRYVCSTEHLMRSKKAKEWSSLISKSDLFDAEYYLSNRKDMLEIARHSPATHFILYGDAEGYNPSHNFSTAYYLLQYEDIRRKKLPALVHYINDGIKEGRRALPSKEDWLNLAEKKNLFSELWYQQNYPYQCVNLNPKTSYITNGWLKGNATSKNFHPDQIPIIQKDCKADQDSYKINKKDPLEIYLSKYALLEYSLYEAIGRVFSNNDFYIVPQIIQELHQNFGETRASLEALGTSLILQQKWKEARSVWSKVWDYFLHKNFVERYSSSVVLYDRSGSHNINNNFMEIEASQLYSYNLQNYKVCIYTTLYGERDDLPPILSSVPEIDYICFTDRPRKTFGWDLRIIDPNLNDDNLNAKVFKILPHIYLQEYDYSLFVDANTVLTGRINDLIKKCLSGSNFVMWKHPERDDIYWEVATIMAHRRHGPEGLIEQVETYANAGIPRKSGLAEGSFIWRKHNEKTITSFMEQWWQHIKTYTSRDQVSLAYLMWCTGLRPSVFPNQLGTSRDNIYFTKIPHKNNPYGSTITSNNYNQINLSCSFKNADLIFLYNSQFSNSGSTVMRGQQLSDLVRSHINDRNVVYTNNDNVSGQILFLTKGYLHSSTPESLERLKKEGNFLIADFVDTLPNDEIVEFIDIIIAASISAFVDYSNRWPHKQIHYITHHVDPRISPPKVQENSQQPKIGYFGEFANTIRTDKIKELVDFYLVDTSSSNSTNWLNYISQYNCHYAVRRTRKIDGYKPLTKGFIAAHCDANIIIQESVTDVKYYLGHDYPYLLPNNPEEKDILHILERIRSEYGGSEWNYGLEIMREVRERSSFEQVIKDFKDLLKLL